ncbi:MAG: LysE family transporter [Hyphomicrobiales bacterium]|nr:LysE family transporter [Hyphomicrobiales bacterium]MCY4053207.1 LysE family transporter [Hyphomicrobiales bacterium]
MDFYSGLALCLGIQALAMMAPGQNHFMLLSVSPAGRIAVVMTTLGIASAGVVFSTGVVLSIWFGGQVISETLFGLLSIAGSGYLIYLGSKFLWSFWKQSQSATSKGAENTLPEENIEKSKMSLLSAFRSGFLVNISNSKSALFFASIFATTLPLSEMGISSVTLAILGFFLNSIVFHGMVGIFFTLKNIQTLVLKWSVYIQTIAGLVFIGFGGSSACYAAMRMVDER